MLIGEVARRSGVSSRMLRHYDALGLVSPSGRTSGGYREYTEADIRRIFHVESLRSLGLSLRRVGQVLADPDFKPDSLVGELISETEQRLERERELLRRLRAVDASEPSDWEEVLRIVHLLRGLASPEANQRQRALLSPGTAARMPAGLLAEAVLAEADPNVSGALRWALARADRGVTARLARGLASADVEVRLRAVRALSEIPGEEAAAALAAALQDRDGEVRRRAALELGARGDAAVVPALVEVVVAGPGDVDAAESLGALARDGAHTRRITDALLDRLAAPDATPAARLRLVQALAELPSGAALEALRTLVDDGDPTVARTAKALAGVIEDRRWSPGGR